MLTGQLAGMRILVVLAVVLAGCASAIDPADDGGDPVPTPVPDHALDGAIEPEAFGAPTFDLLGAVASGGPVYGAGEPSIWAALDGTIYVAFPGCDRSFYLAGPAAPGEEACGNGLVFRSGDDGATWERLNRDGDGRYTDEGPAANNDADVAVDAAGTMYASNLGGGGIQVHRMQPGGSWEYMANVVPEDESADRQWMAAAAPGQLIMAWMRTSPERDVAINVTFDGGQTWLGEINFGRGIGWLGTVQFGPDSQTAYVPYTQPTGQITPGAVVAGAQGFAMHVVRTRDGGHTWEDIDTGLRWESVAVGGHWSGVHMAPNLDVTGDGGVILAWSADVPLDVGGTPATSWSQQTFVSRSGDNGTTWSQAEPLVFLRGGATPVERYSTIMPWVVGGAGDRFAVTWLESPLSIDNDYTATVWDVAAVVVDGFGTSHSTMAHAVIETHVHQGPVCTRGGGCLATGSDRALLDFFESDLTPDGRLVVTYPADPLTGGKYIEVRTAIQSGGTVLLERPEP